VSHILDPAVESILQASFRETEVRTLLARLDALYGRQHSGDDSQPLRSRIQRTELLLAAFQGYPAALAG
jgi:hypothetical protein